MSDLVKTLKYEIYIGLSDKDDIIEKYTLNEVKKIVGEYCKEKNVAFSITELRGGYAHNKGYVIENSLKITLINVQENTMHEIGKQLKQVVNTDTIMFTKEDCEVMYV